MSGLDSLLDRLRRAHAAIAEVENVASRTPGDRFVLANLASLKNDAAKLEAAWEEACQVNRIEVCRYRLLLSEKSHRFALSDVSSSLAAFQELFANIYYARKVGPRKRTRLTDGILGETSLEFGFSYAGSLGIALMAEGDSLLFGSTFDDAIESLLSAITVENEYQVRDMARTLGDVVVKKVFDWSQINFAAGFSVDIDWINSLGLHRGRLAPRQSLGQLAGIIGRTSDVEHTLLRLYGVLVGFDSRSRRFRFVAKDGPDYRGYLGDSFPVLQEWTVNANYVADISAESVTHYATQETKTAYRLDALERVDSA